MSNKIIKLRPESCISESDDYYEYEKGAIIDIIDSLQQEQMKEDLDREIIKYKVPFTDEREYLNETTLDAIARHFWNKGYNARKEESK